MGAQKEKEEIKKEKTNIQKKVKNNKNGNVRWEGKIELEREIDGKEKNGIGKKI